MFTFVAQPTVGCDWKNHGFWAFPVCTSKGFGFEILKTCEWIKRNIADDCFVFGKTGVE